MVKVKGKEVIPSYTLDSLEEFEKITGVDILFKGGLDVESHEHRRALVYVGLKAGGLDIDLEEIGKFSPVEFITIWGACLTLFLKSIGVDPDAVQEEIEEATVEKN